MISDGYASTLKRLITFTQAKFISLADIVGYDVSYVNKWSNGTKLPSSRYVERINEEMGQYFAELIIKQRKKEKFFKTFPITSDTEDLGFEISQYLCSAYRSTLNQNHTPKNKESRPAIKVITGHHDTAAFLADVLQKSIQNLEGDGELLVLGEFNTLYQAGFWKYLENIELGANTLTIRVGVDLDKLEKDISLVQNIYQIINHFLDFDFVFYDMHDIDNANLIILKGSFAVQYALSNPPRFNMCTYIFDEPTVWDVYERFSFTGTSKKALTSLASSLGMDDMGYRTAFYATNSFFFFLANGFEFLLPHEVFDSIIESTSPEKAFSIQRLCLTWEEVLDVSEIEFLMPTTSLLRYVETGYIYLADVQYALTPQERKAHIQSVLEGMQKNPHMVMGILPFSCGDSEYKGENVSFYSNYKTGFLKKNKRYIKNNAHPFYLIINPQFHEIILNYFKSLKELPTYHQYTLDQVTQKYKQYKTLIERTLSLKE